MKKDFFEIVRMIENNENKSVSDISSLLHNVILSTEFTKEEKDKIITILRKAITSLTDSLKEIHSLTKK